MVVQRRLVGGRNTKLSQVRFLSVEEKDFAPRISGTDFQRSLGLCVGGIRNGNNLSRIGNIVWSAPRQEVNISDLQRRFRLNDVQLKRTLAPLIESGLLERQNGKVVVSRYFSYVKRANAPQVQEVDPQTILEESGLLGSPTIKYFLKRKHFTLQELAERAAMFQGIIAPSPQIIKLSRKKIAAYLAKVKEQRKQEAELIDFLKKRGLWISKLVRDLVQSHDTRPEELRARIQMFDDAKVQIAFGYLDRPRKEIEKYIAAKKAEATERGKINVEAVFERYNLNTSAYVRQMLRAGRDRYLVAKKALMFEEAGVPLRIGLLFDSEESIKAFIEKSRTRATVVSWPKAKATRSVA